MVPTNPQFLYIILVLPSLFGLVLVGEGVYKIVQEEWSSGFLTLIFGFLFICLVIGAYFFFTSYLSQRL